MLVHVPLVSLGILPCIYLTVLEAVSLSPITAGGAVLSSLPPADVAAVWEQAVFVAGLTPSPRSCW